MFMRNKHQKGADEDAPAFGSNAESMNETFGSRTSKDVKLWTEQKKQRVRRDRIENLRGEKINKTTRKPVDWRAEESLKREEQAKSASIRGSLMNAQATLKEVQKILPVIAPRSPQGTRNYSNVSTGSRRK